MGLILLQIDEVEMAVRFLKKAVGRRDPKLILPLGTEYWINNPAILEALDTPELNELYRIRELNAHASKSN